MRAGRGSVGAEAAMATGARGAAAIACAGRRWGGGRRVWWWRVQRTVQVDEVRYADGRLARPRDTSDQDRHPLGSKEQLLAAGIWQQCNLLRGRRTNAGLTERKCSAPVSDN